MKDEGGRLASYFILHPSAFILIRSPLSTSTPDFLVGCGLV